MTRIRARLREAQRDQIIVRVQRASDRQTYDGFVVGVGKTWMLLTRTMEGGYFDGHAAIRIDDIRRLRIDTSFESRFSRTRPEWPPSRPEGAAEIDLDSTLGVLRTFPQPGRLVGIESAKRPSCTWIGVPDEILGRWFYLWEVRPDATWHESPRGYRRRDIAMVYSGSHYLTGLTSIAGPPPARVGENWSTPASTPTATATGS
ncbi:hypothetical protein [Microbacterium candidum]|uniref:Uncharacterized protein n=1 Tax=Microbacterium candidum TaxID=3041922 RepID=A0ABT7MU35_9MICO|nr:hypothetical protein [Microbacterium sp. ASV49]MDL9977943.1 hypothetical protein [Microbacterium sp. ASV49]